MIVASKQENHIVLNFARGEELFSTILAWCGENSLVGGTLTGLGACDQLEIAYYNLETRTYERHQVNEDVEIVSLTGNLGTLDGKPMLHLHGSFGRLDLSLFGGHLFSLRVSGACEIHLTPLKSSLVRQYDETTGLNLLCATMRK